MGIKRTGNTPFSKRGVRRGLPS